MGIVRKHFEMGLTIPKVIVHNKASIINKKVTMKFEYEIYISTKGAVRAELHVEQFRILSLQLQHFVKQGHVCREHTKDGVRFHKDWSSF